jgi:hypothetical protein
MIKIENYKIFVNSKDFEFLIKKSEIELCHSQLPYSQSLKKYFKKCINDESILILYENDLPIGFYIICINNRRVELSFTYIISKYRNKGYSHQLRIAGIERFKNKYDKIETYILKNNVASLKGLEKLLEIYKPQYEKKQIIDQFGNQLYHFIIQGFK